MAKSAENYDYLMDKYIDLLRDNATKESKKKEQNIKITEATPARAEDYDYLMDKYLELLRDKVIRESRGMNITTLRKLIIKEHELLGLYIRRREEELQDKLVTLNNTLRNLRKRPCVTLPTLPTSINIEADEKALDEFLATMRDHDMKEEAANGNN